MGNTKRKCKGCKEYGAVNDGLVNRIGFFHDESCIDLFVANNHKKLIKKGRQQREKAQRKKDKVRLEQLKTASDYIKEAQIAVNRYIRARDYGKACISCGIPYSNSYGGKFDAGHYRSRGSASHLRFNVLNIAGQCVTCNRYQSGNAIEYRKGLIKKLGLDRVKQLEHDNEPRKFTIEYLKRLKKIFNKRARFYENRR